MKFLGVRDHLEKKPRKRGKEKITPVGDPPRTPAHTCAKGPGSTRALWLSAFGSVPVLSSQVKRSIR